jgi:hypothetical protein
MAKIPLRLDMSALIMPSFPCVFARYRVHNTGCEGERGLSFVTATICGIMSLT